MKCIVNRSGGWPITPAEPFLPVAPLGDVVEVNDVEAKAAIEAGYLIPAEVHKAEKKSKSISPLD